MNTKYSLVTFMIALDTQTIFLALSCTERSLVLRDNKRKSFPESSRADYGFSPEAIVKNREAHSMLMSTLKTNLLNLQRIRQGSREGTPHPPFNSRECRTLLDNIAV